MGTDSSNTDINISSKCDLDGTELYGVDGQTIVDIREMAIEHIKNFLEGEEW
ncbi:hypothetical protein [Clostridium tetani]|uniref:hypothetical protein n=1 Tax=Clostridium tetani TaxID=1513 RepID=UPI0013E99DA3|nr:hypothetical protein [Clostridium tetani]